jgi:hypothetical protein
MHSEYNIYSDCTYLTDDYISLYLNQSSTIFKFQYIEGDNFFINKAIKKPITKIGNKCISDGFYDLETAYGYGGWYSNCKESEFINNALEAYKLRCTKEKIISEFIRFHPDNLFPNQHFNIMDFLSNSGDIVIVDLINDPLASFSKKVRYVVRSATNTLDINQSYDIDAFIKLYKKTMRKNKAGDFYFFDDSYFEELMKIDSIELYEVKYKDKIVSMGIFIFDKEIAYYHLSANSQESYKLNANYFLLNQIFYLAKDRGVKSFILGGGAGSSPEDGLLRFKKKFSSNVTPFNIGGMIHNEEIYEKYGRIWSEQYPQDRSELFLHYRQKI